MGMTAVRAEVLLMGEEIVETEEFDKMNVEVIRVEDSDEHGWKKSVKIYDKQYKMLHEIENVDFVHLYFGNEYVALLSNATMSISDDRNVKIVKTVQKLPSGKIVRVHVFIY